MKVVALRVLARDRVGESVESALTALAAIFRLLARILTIFDKITVI